MIVFNRNSGEEECINSVAEFLGNCYGVILVHRGKNDPHLCFELVVEDDETWFLYKSGGSSAWLPEVIFQLSLAVSWCEANADPDIHNGIQYGWKERGTELCSHDWRIERENGADNGK